LKTGFSLFTSLVLPLLTCTYGRGFRLRPTYNIFGVVSRLLVRSMTWV